MHSALPQVCEEGEPQTRPHPQRRAVASARWDSYLAHGISSPSALTTRSRLPSVSSRNSRPSRVVVLSVMVTVTAFPSSGAIARGTLAVARAPGVHQLCSVPPATAPYMVCSSPDRAARLRPGRSAGGHGVMPTASGYRVDWRVGRPQVRGKGRAHPSMSSTVQHTVHVPPFDRLRGPAGRAKGGCDGDCAPPRS
jgi:hypothetical protein